MRTLLANRPGRPRRSPLLLPLTLVAVIQVAPLRAGEITPAGQRLARVLDAMQVERHWLPGEPIHWLSGRRDPRGHQAATHCSAFAAAACAGRGISPPPPPQHAQELLANAQNRWLFEVGPRAGWVRVASPLEAQRLANLGDVVVVSYRNPDPHKP